jgi:metallophosphoesterase superfamily enzyme
LRHHPEPLPGRYVLAGHVHPVVTLHGSGRDRLRTPCFVFDEGVGVLPAFGAFTGGFVVDRSAAGRLFVVAGARVLELPAANRHG